VIASCSYCDKELDIPSWNVRRAKNNFCSTKCKGLFKVEEAEKNRPKKTCRHCGKEFSYINKDLKLKRIQLGYCSVECFNEAERVVYTTCDYCGKEIRRHRALYNEAESHYCNIECMGKAKERLVEVTCESCGTKFQAQPCRIGYYTKLFCSQECRMKHFLDHDRYSVAVNDNEYRRLSDKLRHSKEYRLWRKEVLERKESCSECGSKDNLQVHHSEYTLYQIASENNFDYKLILSDSRFLDPNNGDALCKKHHMNHHFKQAI
jgi:hypothetical protein